MKKEQIEALIAKYKEKIKVIKKDILNPHISERHGNDLFNSFENYRDFITDLERLL